MDNLTDYLQREYGWSRNRACKALKRILATDFTRPRDQAIASIQMNNDGTVDVEEIDYSTGRSAFVTLKPA